MKYTDEQIKSITIVLGYLFWAKEYRPRDMCGSHRVEEALDAASKLFGFTRDQVESFFSDQLR